MIIISNSSSSCGNMDSSCNNKVSTETIAEVVDRVDTTIIAMKAGSLDMMKFRFTHFTLSKNTPPTLNTFMLNRAPLYTILDYKLDLSSSHRTTEDIQKATKRITLPENLLKLGNQIE